MAQTTIISSITRSNTYPESISVTAPSNCGMLSIVLDNWTEQMICELPTINVKAFIDQDTVFCSFDIDLRTVKDYESKNPTDPYTIPVYDIPADCLLSVTPIFDNNALTSHNSVLENGNIEFFETSDSGIVQTETVQNNLYWNTPTSIFNVSIIFDNSNIKSGGGTTSPSASDVTFNPSGTSLTSTNVQDAIEELQTNIDNLPEPMIFKGSLGTGGTITTLPTASSDNKGFTYKVITAGTYAGQTAEIGDTFISDGTTWVLIPSGDEPSGTVTNVTVTSTDGSATITGSPITSSGIINVSVNIDSSYDANSTKPVTNSLLTRTMTPMTQSEYDALTNKDLPLYFIYEE